LHLTMQSDLSLRERWTEAAKPLTQALQDCVNRRLGSNAEMLEKVRRLAAFAKAVHADENAVMADHGIPAPAHGGLDGDLDRGIADDGLLLGLRQLQEKLQGGHRNHPRRDAALGKLLLSGDRDLDL